MKITYLGTTVLLFDDGKDQILFDAHLTRPSLLRYMVGSKSTNRKLVDQMVKAHHMDRLRAIFISHTHHDHVMDAPYIARKCKATIYGSSSALNVARGGGVKESQLVHFKGHETYEVGNYRITVIPSLHSKPNILNNDLGEKIEKPLRQPARLRDYKEGGSFDFLVEAGGKKYLIRPSFNYMVGQLDGISADVLYLGIAGIAKADQATRDSFFAETVDKVKPEVIIPLHWDNFFSPLDRPIKGMPGFVEDTRKVFYELARYCEAKDIACLVQMPRTFINL